jgi:transcription initiation factor TFIIIB Brf1 subunit/transcription initiation factor TFIIB
MVILTNNGYTCADCGMVVEELYTQDNFFIGPKENYESKSAKQFVALGKQIDNVSQLGSYIDYYTSGVFFDSKNAPLSPERQKLFYRLKFTRDFRSRLENNETEYRVIKILKAVSSTIEILPDVRKRALYMYNKVMKKVKTNNQKIPNHVSLIATCLLLAAKERTPVAPITIQELCNAFLDNGHRVNCKMIIRDMLKFKQFIGIKKITHDGKDYLERLVNKLHYDQAFKDRFDIKAGSMEMKPYLDGLIKFAKELLEAIPKQVKICRNPFILSGASIYGADFLVAKELKTKRVLTQKLLSDATGIAEYSIRDHFCAVVKPVLDERRLKEKKQSTKRDEPHD